MKTYKNSIIAGVAGIVLTAASLQGAIITHFDIDFTTNSTGTLPPTGWLNSNVTAVIEESGGNKYLGLTASTPTGSRSLILSTTTKATPPTLTLNIAASSAYQWSFSFLLPTGALGAVNPALIRLDDGASGAGHFITGLSIRNGMLEYLTNPNVNPLSSQMTGVSTSIFQLQENVWYQATFDITTAADLKISYNLNITGGITSFSTTVTDLVPSALTTNTAVRAAFGSSDGTLNVKLDNLYLATVPEPGVVGLVAMAALLALCRSRRR